MISAKAARKLTYNNTFSTLTPFLYQTFTLYNTRLQLISHNLSSTTSKGRQFSSQSSLRSPDDTQKSSSTNWTPLRNDRGSQSKEITVEETTLQGGRERGTYGRGTWTSLQPNSAISGKSADYTSAQTQPHDSSLGEGSETTIWGNHATGSRRRMDEVMGMRDYTRAVNADGEFEQAYESIDFDEEMDGDAISNKDEIAELTRNQPLGESTITDSERHAFQKVFRDMFGKSQGGGIGIGDTIDSAPSKTDLNRDKPTRSANGARRMSRFEMEEMVARYPVALRSAAARAIGLTEVEAEGDEEAFEAEPELDIERLEALREPERKRVEALMKGAKSDFELWEIMEKEVFSLVPRLGLEEAAKADQVKKRNVKKKDRKNPKEQVKLANASPKATLSLEKFSVNEDGISPLALYGPLYPSHLLLGLRLLDRSFAKSSSLTLALLPKIKSLGLISHVLGASSQLYNELLQIHRYRYDDYRGILALLQEMESSGIEYDKETLEIIKDIQRTQLSVRRGEKGAIIQSLWNLPEFAPNKFRVWHDKIARDINSREMARQTTMRY